MVAAGVAGNSAHMMASAVLALARLVYAYRQRESMAETSVQLLQTVCTLLQHKAQEVVRAAITFCKVRRPPPPAAAPTVRHLPPPLPQPFGSSSQVALSALPPHLVQPLLPSLVPPLLTWCSNKHPHLKTQARIGPRLDFPASLPSSPCSSAHLKPRARRATSPQHLRASPRIWAASPLGRCGI